VTSNVGWAPSTAVLTLGQWPGASPANRVTFRAALGENVAFDASATAMGVFFNGADYVTIEGIEIMNAPFDGVTLYSEAQHGQAFDPVIRRCRIHDCAAAGVVIYGNAPRPQNTVVENCFFWNLQATNAGGFGSLARFGYVSGRRHDNSRVIHNTFYVSTAAGNAFAVIGDMPSGAETRFTEISNNIIHKVAGPTAPVYGFPTAVTAAIDSNCYFDTSGGPFSSGAVVSATFAAWLTASGQDTTSLATNPFLMNGTAGDLHLVPGSPCMDASTVVTAVLDDIDGQPRGGLFDIGADEVACAGQQFETNDAASFLAVDGVQTTGCLPAITVKAVGSQGMATFQSTNVGQPWEVVVTYAPLVPFSAGVPVSNNGQMVNVSWNIPGTWFFNGGNIPGYTVPFAFSFTAPFTSPSAPVTLGLQMVNFDPSHPDGFALSQGCQVDVQ